jgi:hypothetical protein
LTGAFLVTWDLLARGLSGAITMIGVRSYRANVFSELRRSSVWSRLRSQQRKDVFMVLCFCVGQFSSMSYTTACIHDMLFENSAISIFLLAARAAHSLNWVAMLPLGVIHLSLCLSFYKSLLRRKNCESNPSCG